ncbi:hypothetical protein M426DRAFT_128668 [Hypoxylon sp. CI-4A]|nr:hypothetical protein M426DRAFT_128668 [Hypoxylon sp. CI-4A]
MAFKITILVVALAALLPSLYDTYFRLTILLGNAPEKLLRINNLKSHEIKFRDSFRSCEDVVLIPSKGVAILSCDPGRESWNTVMGIFSPGPVPGAEIYGYDYKEANTQDSDNLRRFDILDYEPETDFHTLGMAYDEESSTLFVVNHRKSGSTIELFKLDLATWTAKHFRTLRHPLLYAPNALTLINNHELLITNDHYFILEKHPLLGKLETYLGLPLASVVHVDLSSLLEDPSSTVEAIVLARLPFANGIGFLNETTVAVASTSKPGVYFYTITTSQDSTNTSPLSLTYQSNIRLPYWVDNIHISLDGTLYIAGHPHPPTLDTFSKTRLQCNAADLTDADPSVQEQCKTISAPSWISRWTEETGLEHLYVGVEYPSSSTAVFDSERNVGIVSGLYGKGILVWRE